MEGKPTYVVQGKQLVEQPDGEEEEKVAPAEEPSLLLETSAVSEMLEPLHYEESKERKKLEVPPLIQAPKRGELIETELPYEAPSSEESFQVKARIEAEPRLAPIENKLQDKPEVEPSRQLTKTKELIESVRETQLYRPEKERATETSTPETHQPFTPQKSKAMKVKQLEPQQVGEQPIQLQPFMEGKPTYVVQGKQLVEQPDGEEEEKVAPAEEPSLLLETSAVSEMLEPLHYEESKERQKLEVPPLIQAPKRGELIETELPYEAPSSEESFQVKARIEAEPRLAPIENKLQDKPEVEPSRQLTKTKELIESVRETQLYRPEKNGLQKLQLQRHISHLLHKKAKI
ncbi:hypothetical protein HPP92_004422 [Vanilla planifolia]|uniref:Uncharacterized protein n=1 Tax=Vanilla planifolia TaxID=51239 RepID=A0A835RWR1_VANPL|nr:hypothetical protein HPP92_004422 [Vanilla planifolia]